MNSQDTIMDAVRSILKPIVREVLDEANANQPSTPHNHRRVYTRQQVCNMLQIGTTTFYRLVKKGKLTILKVEGKTVIDADDFDKAIDDKEVFRYQHS